MQSNKFSRHISTLKGVIQVDIDSNSGFCFGVVNAISLAEKELKQSGELLSIGNIVHNEEEVDRLHKVGLKAVDNKLLGSINNTKVLFRAHGEPPSSYEMAKSNNNAIIDATCPVVLKLQQRIKAAWKESKTTNGQVIVFGKHDHAEVLGLVGQTQNQAIVIENEADLAKVDVDKPAVVFSQTTMSIEKYKELDQKLSVLIKQPVKIHDTICRQVANRAPKLKEFVQNYDLILFVSGTKSSNGKYLYSVCKKVNSESYFISNTTEINVDLLIGKSKIGICGATSTPNWLMEEVADFIQMQLCK